MFNNLINASRVKLVTIFQQLLNFVNVRKIIPKNQFPFIILKSLNVVCNSYIIKHGHVVIHSQVVNVFSEPIPRCFDFIELRGNHIEPRIGFRDLHRGQDDQVGHLGLGAHQGELVLHGQKIGQRSFVVQFFLRFFSDFFRLDLDGAWTFTLDNLDKSQEKSNEKLRFFFQKMS